MSESTTPLALNAGQQRPKICLNMIVKNESQVIERLLRSVKDFINYYVIVDTGSEDGTPELIRRVSGELGIPGEVHYREWVDFGHNRQQALDLAVASGQSDWLLFIDADEELAWKDPEWPSKLHAGTSYQLEKHQGHYRYALSNLVWIHGVRWTWHGVLHEYITPDWRCPSEVLQEAWIIFHIGQGARSTGLTQEQKFLRDVALLEATLAKTPDDPRNRFYLAQSYRDAGELQKAYEHYTLRTQMDGWDEETWMAQFEKARLAIRLKHGHGTILEEHLKAYSLRPSRVESLWQLTAYCRENKRYAEGYVFAKTGKETPMTQDRLFVMRSLYEWRMLDEFAICAFWAGHYEESAEATRRILQEGLYDSNSKPRLEANLQSALAKMESAAN